MWFAGTSLCSLFVLRIFYSARRPRNNSGSHGTETYTVRHSSSRPTDNSLQATTNRSQQRLTGVRNISRISSTWHLRHQPQFPSRHLRFPPWQKFTSPFKYGKVSSHPLLMRHLTSESAGQHNAITTYQKSILSPTNFFIFFSPSLRSK